MNFYKPHSEANSSVAPCLVVLQVVPRCSAPFNLPPKGTALARSLGPKLEYYFVTTATMKTTKNFSRII